jgi:hypothetical protein
VRKKKANAMNNTAQLEAGQREAFRKDGVLLLKDFAPKRAVMAVLRQYNIWRNTVITQGADDKTRGDIARARQAMDVTEGEEIAPLRQLAHDLGGALLGPDNVHELEAQLIGWAPSGPAWKPTWHIDWVNKHLRLKTEDQFPGFQLLVGFPLTPALQEDCGNLFVSPGQHTEICNMFRQSPTLRDPLEAISKGMASRVPWGTPQQLLVAPGDVILTHSLIPHGVAENKGASFADKLYFRLAHKTDIHRGGRDALDTPWRNWQGMQDGG